VKILVVHSNLAAGGGAEIYAHAVIGALRAKGHAVATLDITGHRAPNGDLHRIGLFRLADLPGLRGKHLFAYALVCRKLRLIADTYEAVVLTYGEGPALPIKALRILHAPCLFSARAQDIAVLRSGLSGVALLWRQAYALLCRCVARPRLGGEDGVMTLANSQWTSRRAKLRCGVAVHDIV